MIKPVTTSMTDQRDEEETICVRNCCLDDDNVCLGCGRMLSEILEWHHATSTRRTEIKHHATERVRKRVARLDLKLGGYPA